MQRPLAPTTISVLSAPWRKSKAKETAVFPPSGIFRVFFLMLRRQFGIAMKFIGTSW